MLPSCFPLLSFCLTDSAPTRIYSLSLHDALPIFQDRGAVAHQRFGADDGAVHHAQVADGGTLADLGHRVVAAVQHRTVLDRKSTRLNSSHPSISYAVFCLKKKKNHNSKKKKVTLE